MKRKILVLGAGGMLGSMLFRYLSEKIDFHTIGTLSKNEGEMIPFLVDFTFRKQIQTIVSQIKPDYIINCIGYIRPNKSYTSFKNALLINAIMPKYLSEYCLLNNIRFIHISTDCVFSGNKGNYSDTDLPDESSIYGITKYLGEACKPPNITLRTSIVGREDKSTKNLLEWFIKTKEEVIDGYSKVLWNGVTTLTLSKIIYRIIKKEIYFNKPLIQIASAPMSKYHLLHIFREVYNKKITIKKNASIKSNKTLLASKEQEKYFSDIIAPLDVQLYELREYLN
ncbi:MAG: SDR family oxidoreductase [Candidatus Roizmanbacteria bacterium]|nr:SDR family oxidoreductase [Candidatus Roizmanbacteria bacterium]